MSLLELFAALITAYSVWLTARENIWCWPTGVVSVILYGWIFWQAKLYANAWLQAFYLVLIAYGWYEWLTAENMMTSCRSRELPSAAGPSPSSSEGSSRDL